jgi:ribosome biogenesis protein Nip4
MKRFNLNIATKNQMAIIKTGLDHASSDIWSELGKISYNFYSKPGKPHTNIFLVRHEDVRFIKGLKESIGKFIEHTGIFFGFIKKGEFMLGLEGAEFLIFDVDSKNNLNLKKVILDDSATKSFLYGNHVKPESFLQKPKILNKKDLVFVFDSRNSFLGIGFIFKWGKTSKSGAVDVEFAQDVNIELRNLIDYGYYIRRGY